MMAAIPEELIERIEAIAQAENRTIAEVLEAMLQGYPQQPRRSTLAEMAQNALEAGLSSPEPVNTADNSREILKNEYADYLKRRLESSSNDDHR